MLSQLRAQSTTLQRMLWGKGLHPRQTWVANGSPPLALANPKYPIPKDGLALANPKYPILKDGVALANPKYPISKDGVALANPKYPIPNDGVHDQRKARCDLGLLVGCGWREMQWKLQSIPLRSYKWPCLAYNLYFI